jgi:hypothetical protein
MPAALVLMSALVGSLGKGWSGMRPSDRICWPATPKEVLHSSLKDWFHGDQLSFGRSRMSAGGWAAAVESMVGMRWD